MIHEILPVGALQCNCSIFGDEQTREAIVIDPGDNIDQILEILARHSLKVKAIVITHAHIDHIGGAAKLKAATGAAVHMNASDQALYDHLDVQAAWLQMKTPERTAIDTEARDGDSLKLGDAGFVVLHTPGHTQGSISLWIPADNTLSAGDTLFLHWVATEAETTLPDEVEVVPGHGAGTTIGREREQNPFLRGL